MGNPNLAFNSSLHGCPPELELSTSETPLSAGLGGNEPRRAGKLLLFFSDVSYEKKEKKKVIHVH